MKAEGVSVIICCYNSAERLPQTLRHLSQQKVPGALEWEVIVVDNASQDDTAATASTLWKELSNTAPLVVVHEPEPGLSSARSRGISQAKYEYLIFCDDDNWLQSDYVRLVHEILASDEQIGVVGGCNEVVADVQVPAWFHEHEAFYAVGCQGKETGEVPDRNFVFGAGMGFRKSVYERIRAAGFTHLLSDRKGAALSSGGDVELGYIYKILGFKIWFDKRLKLRHYMSEGRLQKEYLEKLRQSGLQTMKVLQVYDPYLRSGGVVRASPVKLAYFVARYIAASIMPGKNSAYYLTYLEANNFLPVRFSKTSAKIKDIIRRFHRLK